MLLPPLLCTCIHDAAVNLLLGCNALLTSIDDGAVALPVGCNYLILAPCNSVLHHLVKPLLSLVQLPFLQTSINEASKVDSNEDRLKNDACFL